MGLLGDIVKSITRGVVNAEVNKAERNIVNKVEDSIGKEVKSLKKEESKYSVPEEYMHFPQFDGVIDDLSTKNESKYTRCTIDYGTNVDSINEYIDKVVESGYKKMTNVRYEKGNEYIIVEPGNNYLHLVFHIKK